MFWKESFRFSIFLSNEKLFREKVWHLKWLCKQKAKNSRERYRANGQT